MTPNSRKNLGQNLGPNLGVNLGVVGSTLRTKVINKMAYLYAIQSSQQRSQLRFRPLSADMNDDEIPKYCELRACPVMLWRIVYFLCIPQAAAPMLLMKNSLV